MPLPKKSTPRLPEFQVSTNCLSCPLTRIALSVEKQMMDFGKHVSCILCSISDLYLHIDSQEFHLKTSERARQHTTASASSLQCNDTDKVVCLLSLLNFI